MQCCSYPQMGHLWQGHHIVFHVDNSAVVSAISSGTNPELSSYECLRWIVMLAAQLGFTYSSSCSLLLKIP